MTYANLVTSVNTPSPNKAPVEVLENSSSAFGVEGGVRVERDTIQLRTLEQQ